ncbi:MAG: helix-turn-helix domain-containing protein, partial [Bacteroidota bacterium]
STLDIYVDQRFKVDGSVIDQYSLVEIIRKGSSTIITGAGGVAVFTNDFQGYEAFMKYGLLLIFVSGIVYVIWSSLLLNRHKRNIREQFSDLEEVNLRWLQFLTYGMGVIWAIVVITNNDPYIFSGVTIFVILIGFFGVQQRTIFLDDRVSLAADETTASEVSTTKQKYARSGLNDEKAKELYDQLLELFKTKGSHRKKDLSLTDLAKALDTHPNYLSQIINAQEKKSFYDFVNSFRVEEFKQLIKDQKHKQFTLLALAYECGFNSKSSLNRHFKKSTGQTPSEYVRSFEA